MQKFNIKATNLLLERIILHEKLKEDYKKKQVMQKLHKKLSILIHIIKEDGNNIRDKCQKTIKD